MRSGQRVMRRLLTSVPLVELRSSIDQYEPVKVSWAWRRDTLGSRRAMSETERSRPMVTCAEVMLWLSPLTTSTSWASGRCGARVLAMLEAIPAAAPRPTAAPVGGSAHTGEGVTRDGLRHGDGRGGGVGGVGRKGIGHGERVGSGGTGRRLLGHGGGALLLRSGELLLAGAGSAGGAACGRVVLAQAILVGALFLVQTTERGGVDVLGKDRELTGTQLGVDHKANEGFTDKDIAALFGLCLHKLADLARKLGVERGEHGIVVGGDQDGIECRRGVDAVDHQSLILHVASGLLGKLLKGERGTGGTEDAGHVVLEDVQEVHERSLSV